MQLAFVLYKYFPYGGLQRDFRRFVQELQQRGHGCRVYCISWQGEHLPGVDLRILPIAAASNVGRNERFVERVQAELAADPVDAVIGFNKMPGLDIYYAGDPCYLDKALQQRGWWYRCSARFRHFAGWERAVFGLESETRILLIAETERRKFERHYHTPAARMQLLPAGVAADRRAPPDALTRREQTRTALALKARDLVMLLVGSGFITKGLDRAIRAVASLQGSQAGRDICLLVVGQDREDRFRRLSRRLGVQDRVRFLGGRDDVPELLLAADVLIHPARQEAAGVVLLEALVAGLPVVTTDVCGYAHHIEAAGAGIVLPAPFSQAQLDTALEGTLDAGLLAGWAGHALDYSRQKDLYSMHSTGAGLIEDIVEQLVAKRDKSRQPIPVEVDASGD
jgi:UDP-glucose:(heptosyl)LPS alpha-1,3-glucosyltransferase